MENFEYYKAFPSNTEETGELSPSEKKTMKHLLDRYERELLIWLSKTSRASGVPRKRPKSGRVKFFSVFIAHNACI